MLLINIRHYFQMIKLIKGLNYSIKIKQSYIFIVLIENLAINYYRISLLGLFCFIFE